MIMIFGGIFFIFLKILIFRVVSGVKGHKMMVSPGGFSFSQNCDFLGC